MKKKKIKVIGIIVASLVIVVLAGFLLFRYVFLSGILKSQVESAVPGLKVEKVALVSNSSTKLVIEGAKIAAPDGVVRFKAAKIVIQPEGVFSSLSAILSSKKLVIESVWVKDFYVLVECSSKGLILPISTSTSERETVSKTPSKEIRILKISLENGEMEFRDEVKKLNILFLAG